MHAIQQCLEISSKGILDKFFCPRLISSRTSSTEWKEKEIQRMFFLHLPPAKFFVQICITLLFLILVIWLLIPVGEGGVHCWDIIINLITITTFSHSIVSHLFFLPPPTIEGLKHTFFRRRIIKMSKNLFSC